MNPVLEVPRVDVVVIGGGPAGVAAATLAAELGLSVELLDERPELGGHRHRREDTLAAPKAASAGGDRARWRALLDAFSQSGAGHRAGAKVWAVEPEPSAARIAKRPTADAPGSASGSLVRGTLAGEAVAVADQALRVSVSVAGRSTALITRKLVIATGAQERPFAVPGWTLPGVMDATALHERLASDEPVPSGPIALAGCGPLLYESAARLLRAGGEVVALFDTLRRSNLVRALPYAAGFMRSPYFAAGGTLLRYVNDRVKIMRGVTLLEALGNDGLATVRFAGGGATGQVPASTLVLHQGLIPSIQLTGALGCIHEWNERERWWQPRTDRWGATSVAGVHVTGDAAAVAGAAVAESAGRLCALGIACDLGAITPERRNSDAGTHRRALSNALRGHRFLARLFAPPRAFRLASSNTIVCRCEGVTAGEVRQCVREGCTGPNQLKAFSRCGMGACQGRMCGLAVTEIIAAERGTHPSDVGHFRLRFPTSPITLGELASMPRSASDEAAVHRRDVQDLPHEPIDASATDRPRGTGRA